MSYAPTLLKNGNDNRKGDDMQQRFPNRTQTQDILTSVSVRFKTWRHHKNIKIYDIQKKKFLVQVA